MMNDFRFAGAVLLVALAGACGGPTAGVAPLTADGRPAATSAPSANSSGQAAAVVELDCGDFHCCLRDAGGQVRCWGGNAAGQTASRNQSDPTPVEVPAAKGAVELALGGTFSCARMGDGTVLCWGSGKITADGKAQENAPPTRVAVDGAVQLEADGLVACARLKTGAVRCWGAKAAHAPPLDNASDVKVAQTHACALLKNGSIRCWGADGGWNRSGVDSFQTPPVQGARQLLCVDGAACALLGDGTVGCWGQNLQGEMGTPADVDDHVTAVPVPGVQGAKEIMSGTSHGCALTADGKAICWGTNDGGELGRGSASAWEQPGPVTVLSEGIREIAFGVQHACARTVGGGVSCWGGNTAGQLGDGTRQSRFSPQPVVGTPSATPSR